MKTTNFTPKACRQMTDDEGKVTEPTFSGSIELKVPTFFERQKLKTMLIIAVSNDSGTDLESLKSGGGKVNVAKIMEQMGELVRESVPFYQKVEIKNLRTGEDHKCFDDLSCDPDADAMVQEIAQEIAGGLGVSKN